MWQPLHLTPCIIWACTIRTLSPPKCADQSTSEGSSHDEVPILRPGTGTPCQPEYRDSRRHLTRAVTLHANAGRRRVDYNYRFRWAPISRRRRRRLVIRFGRRRGRAPPDGRSQRPDWRRSISQMPGSFGPVLRLNRRRPVCSRDEWPQ